LVTLASLENDPRHVFVHGDIGDRDLVKQLLAEHKPRAIINFAAESHVDRSIHGPSDFVQTNIVGTFNLLECAREYWNALEGDAKQLGILGGNNVFGPTNVFNVLAVMENAKGNISPLIDIGVV